MARGSVTVKVEPTSRVLTTLTALVVVSGDMATGLVLVVLSFVLVILVFALVFGWLSRIAGLLILLAIAPAALACYALPYTEGAAKLWWRSMLGCLGTQALQVVTVVSGLKVLLDPSINLPGIIGMQGGAIVNLTSVAGIRPTPVIGIYGMSKAALKYLTELLAVELAPKVRVNAVAPAVVKTVFARALYEGREEQAAATYPLRRLGIPSDVAGAVAYLLSDDASWVTGQTLVIDGGLTLAGGLA